MARRYFEHIHSEVSLALGRRVSRYDLWLRLWESGGDPDALTREDVRRFVHEPSGLGALLHEAGGRLRPGSRRRLARRLVRFDPTHPTPEEWLTRWVASDSNAA